jgi:signal transduction histidine kinase
MTGGPQAASAAGRPGARQRLQHTLRSVWRLTLWQRMSLVLAALLLLCGGLTAWMQVRANRAQEQEVEQRLSRGLAEHIAGHTTLMNRDGLNPAGVHALFDMLMVVNPSVEVYVLGLDGQLEGYLAPAGHLKRDRVDLAPIHRFLAGDALPIYGDDPRSDSALKVFSAAPLRIDGRDAGYVYVVLLGEDRDALAAAGFTQSAWRTTLWSIGLVVVLGLGGGLLAFGVITRPLRALTASVRRLEREGFDAVAPAAGAEPTDLAATLPRIPPTAEAPGMPDLRGERDEIALLRLAFEQMSQRIAAQWRELVRQDQQRRELVANISHDLRTPLTSLHGYLETLAVKSNHLSDAERRRYLDTALAQSRKVGRLAQELFELARLEYGAIKPDKEPFSLAELVYDVFQKFELAAEARQMRLTADFVPGLPGVSADLAMIERVLTNLLDNAIRHTPLGGEIRVTLRPVHGQVEVQVEDTGPGIPAELRPGLFTRPSVLSRAPFDRSGGLGLIIVHRILRLHESDIRLLDRPGHGAVFCFGLQASGV